MDRAPPAATTTQLRPADDVPPAPLDESEEVDNMAEDIGNVVSFEHLNLEVTDLETARLFFSEGLGLTLDPSRIGAQRGGMQVLWFNIGKQQFHICIGPVPQRLPTPGSAIGLILPDLDAVASQLQQLKAYREVQFNRISRDILEVIDPYGQCYMVHAPSTVPNFVGDRGIAYVRLPCYVGTAADIARFYSTKLGALARVHTNSAPNKQGTQTAEVRMGHPGTRLLFEERQELGSEFTDESVLSLFSGWHCAFYIANFSGTYSRLRPLLFNSHPYKDKVHNFKDALHYHQYRFQDIVRLSNEHNGNEDAQPGQLLYRISHECRSTAHPNFLRPLYNR